MMLRLYWRPFCHRGAIHESERTIWRRDIVGKQWSIGCWWFEPAKKMEIWGYKKEKQEFLRKWTLDITWRLQQSLYNCLVVSSMLLFNHRNWTTNLFSWIFSACLAIHRKQGHALAWQYDLIHYDSCISCMYFTYNTTNVFICMYHINCDWVHVRSMYRHMCIPQLFHIRTCRMICIHVCTISYMYMFCIMYLCVCGFSFICICVKICVSVFI